MAAKTREGRDDLEADEDTAVIRPRGAGRFPYDAGAPLCIRKPACQTPVSTKAEKFVAMQQKATKRASSKRIWQT
jgi:hypothetical protein